MVYLGSAVFKILRLTFIALFFVHLMACIFFRVKETSAASEEDVVDFYASRSIEADVSLMLIQNSYEYITFWFCFAGHFKSICETAPTPLHLTFQPPPSLPAPPRSLRIIFLFVTDKLLTYPN